MDTREIFVAAARKCLSAGRKSVSVPQSLDIAAQLSAVDFALKPSLLYDTNSASVEQVHQYLRLCQSSQLVSESLVTLDLNGSSLIVNPLVVCSILERVLQNGGPAVIDVSHSLEKPTIADPVTGRLKSIAQDLLFLLGGFDAADDKGVYVAERSDEWNLSAVFGLLLGYPITYWFNQTESFDNCLSMTPLMVTTAHATWQAGSTRDKCCLYSFSIPAVLQNETQSYLEDWKLGLQERFQQQNVLKDLDVCQSAVTLPSVCL
ncbi:UPF0739 protein C1orf74 homolog isoform X1 [Dunckerocampus dactyliophorus]|uniref:UPF0739 protein C1orf74 homolog isoform X1 n=1 Tax=Dunckerocampus dactyliophorus TaxID=161453 RepID=UPI00240713BD|nr:UPF0739 protein C1orf74 homolog isoform X1 [Dunckerocampus dactyliophorus]